MRLHRFRGRNERMDGLAFPWSSVVAWSRSGGGDRR
jgi:hypothetical protein